MVEPNSLFFSGPERTRDLCVVTNKSHVTSRATLALPTTRSDFLGPLLLPGTWAGFHFRGPAILGVSFPHPSPH